MAARVVQQRPPWVHPRVVREDPGQEVRRVVRLQPGAPVRRHRERRCVRLAEPERGELGDGVPGPLGGLGVDTALRRAPEEVLAETGQHLLVDRGACGRGRRT